MTQNHNPTDTRSRCSDRVTKSTRPRDADMTVKAKCDPVIEEANDSGVTGDYGDGGSSSDTDSDGGDGADAIALRDRPTLPNIGSISIQNSSDVHFGNKTVYHGPVTIKQIVYPTGAGGEKLGIENGRGEVGNGEDNPAFEDGGEGAEKCAGGAEVERDGEVGKGYKWLRKLPLRRPIETVIFLSVVLLSLVILLIVLFWKHPAIAIGPSGPHKGEEGESIHPVDYQSDLSNNTLASKVRIVSREEWVAQPPGDQINPLKTPVPYVIIHHTATDNCTSQAQCVFRVRYIQMFHIESRNFSDIGYNFLVGGDGAAYEGRGWTFEGAHTLYWNAKSIGIAFIGTFMNRLPPQTQIDACKKLIAKGVDLGYISKNYKLLGARQLSGTESPGKVLFEEMKTWGHWSATAN